MSCEPGRKSAYSSDLMIWPRIAMELSVRKVAHNLIVSVGTVYNTCKLFEHTGSVDRQCKPNRVNTRKLSHYDELVILGLLLHVDDPGLYLGEVCCKVFSITGIQVSSSTICHILHRHGKKIQQVALQRSSVHRLILWQRSNFLM